MKLSHPGEILRTEIIDGRGLTISKASGLLGISRPSLSNVLSGKASITPHIALRIEIVFGGTAKFWIRLQSAYDLDIAKEIFEKNPPNIQHHLV